MTMIHKRIRLAAAISRFVALVLLATLAACQHSGEPPPREGLIEVPGGKVWYRVEGFGPAIPLVLLHGGPGAGSYYLEPLAERLSDERPVIPWGGVLTEVGAQVF